MGEPFNLEAAITQWVSIEFVNNLGPTHHSIAVRSGQLPFLGACRTLGSVARESGIETDFSLD